MIFIKALKTERHSGMHKGEVYYLVEDPDDDDTWEYAIHRLDGEHVSWCDSWEFNGAGLKKDYELCDPPSPLWMLL